MGDDPLGGKRETLLSNLDRATIWASATDSEYFIAFELLGPPRLVF
jgi:hypothetical protein